MQTKNGVIFIFPHPGLVYALDIVNLVWRHLFGKPPTITSGRDGTHSTGSLHYGTKDDFRERAFDLRTRDLTETQKNLATVTLRKWLGEGFDVVLEETHIHIEVDLRELV